MIVSKFGQVKFTECLLPTKCFRKRLYLQIHFFTSVLEYNIKYYMIAIRNNKSLTCFGHLHKNHGKKRCGYYEGIDLHGLLSSKFFMCPCCYLHVSIHPFGIRTPPNRQLTSPMFIYAHNCLPQVRYTLCVCG